MNIDGKGRGNAVADQAGGPDGYCVEPGHWHFAGSYSAKRVGRNGWNIYRGPGNRVHWTRSLREARAWILEQR
jgi:hypothetical protein